MNFLYNIILKSYCIITYVLNIYNVYNKFIININIINLYACSLNYVLLLLSIQVYLFT